MKLFVKVLSGIVAASIVVIFVLYGFWLKPIIAQFASSSVKLDCASSETSGFPFKTIIKIDKPALTDNNISVWKGEGAVIEWSISRPTSVTIRLKGRHIVTLQKPDPALRKTSQQLYLADTTGFVKVANLNRVVIDIRGNKIGLYSGNLLNPEGHTKTLGAEKIYLSYDGPSLFSDKTDGGNINISAETIDVERIPNVPFKEHIDRLSFKSDYDIKTKTHVVSNFILFWDKLRMAGNGTYSSVVKNGDFIIAVTGFDALVKALYAKRQLPESSVRELIYGFNKLQEQQKKAENMPVYMPMTYRNYTVKIMGVDILTVPQFFAD